MYETKIKELSKTKIAKMDGYGNVTIGEMKLRREEVIQLMHFLNQELPMPPPNY